MQRELSWATPEDCSRSFIAMFAEVDRQSLRAIDWYNKRKDPLKRKGRAYRQWAIYLFSAAVGLPFVIGTLRPWFAAADQAIAAHTVFSGFDFTQLSFVLLVIAGALIALDHFVGGTSGWIRYTLTATLIERLRIEFHHDWAKLTADLAAAAKDEDRKKASDAIFARLRLFAVTVAAEVETETKTWAVEFQRNLAAIEQAIRERTPTGPSGRVDDNKLGG